MKINLRSIFRFIKKWRGISSGEDDEIYYNKHVDVYHLNLINSIILFTYNTNKLKEMEPILIDPLTELYEELVYAFTPVCFETIFRLELIDDSLKNELLEFKNEVENISPRIWDWEFIDNHEKWKTIRNKANSLLDKLGVTNRIYNDNYTVIYDQNGNIVHKGKNCS